MWHDLVIAVHALFATVGFVAALVILLSRFAPPPSGAVVRVHTVCIVVMSATLPISIVLGWQGFAPIARPIFLGLAVLSVYMIVRALQAEKAWRVPDPARVVGHVGFNAIALTTGFFAVFVLRLGLGWVSIVVVALGIPVAGHFWLNHRTRAVAASAATTPVG